MQPLTQQGWQKILELANRYGVSTDAVMALLQALVNGNGTMAQFNHWELGGGGQWMQGGMTMVGDMFNYGLKSKVDGLCSELSQLLAQQPFQPAPVSGQWQGQGQGQGQGQWGQGQQQQQGGGSGPGQGQGNAGMMGGNAVSLFVPPAPGNSGHWWPGDLGVPNSSGGQNDVRYAYFAQARRLAVELHGHVTVYDTLDHQIGGVSQQQGAGSSLTFTSQYGTVSVASLPVVSIDGQSPNVPEPPLQAEWTPQPQAWPAPTEPSSAPPAQEADIFAKIERLADLQQKGIISQDEFSAKKAELLSRL